MAYKNPEKQRAYAKAHYEANKLKYKNRAKKHTEKTRMVVRKLIFDYLTSHPCVDCGESDPIVLEFDHRDGNQKEFNIANSINRGYAPKRVIEEMNKCDVRCANCHRRKTYYERGLKWKTQINQVCQNGLWH